MTANAQLSVCVPARPGPQLASTAKIAEVHHKHYGIYEKQPARSVQAGAQKIKTPAN